MFTMAKIRNGSTYLESHLGANDYYSKGERVAGVWVGLGADKLGLSGEVTPAQFEALRTNQNPLTGGKLTPRTKETREASTREAESAFEKKHHRPGSAAEVEAHRLGMGQVSNRVAFFDFQCSAQKSVSIMAVLAGDERLREAHGRASVTALRELERFASRQNNTPTARQLEMTGNICGAAFTHDASRALDPQLHTHFVLANATQADSGKWYALNESLMCEAIRYAGKVYQNEIAREVKALGYEIRHIRENGDVTGFEIEGVSKALCERFAKRRAEIEHEMEKFKMEQGRDPTRAEVSAITRKTRPSELREITTAGVREFQFGQLDAEEWKQLQDIHRQAREKAGQIRPPADLEKPALKAAVEHLYERKSVLREHEILAQALNQNLGSLDLAKLTSLAQAEKGGLIRLVDDPAQPLRSEYATREGLASELWMVNFIKRTNGTCAPLNPNFQPADKLSLEQSEAVQTILRCQNQVQLFRGAAGTGKTTTMGEVRRGVEEAGRRLVAIAPTASAVKTLQEEGFQNATTLADFLLKAHSIPDLENAVVHCDEASLQSIQDGKALLKLAEMYNLQLILSGDTKQHGSVEAGDCLRILEDHSPLSRCEVLEIRRQQHKEYRSAVGLMAEGASRDGMAALDKLGWVHEGQSNYLKKAAISYIELTDGGKNLDRCLAICPTWEENRLLTREIRSGLKERGLLSKAEATHVVHQSLNWTTPQRGNWRNYETGQVVTFTKANRKWKAGESATVKKVELGKILIASSDKESFLPLKAATSFDVAASRAVAICPGDKILITANRKKLGLINGQVLTVAKIDPTGSIETKEGKTIPENFKQWGHGYVVTSHKAQGRTCEHVVGAAARLDAKAAYVLTSRGRQSCTLHTPDKTALIAHLPEGNRKSALDVLAASGKERPSIRTRPQAWQTAQMQGRKARARHARHTDRLRNAVRRWRGERQVWSHLQNKIPVPGRTPDRSLSHEAVRSVERNTFNKEING